MGSSVRQALQRIFFSTEKVEGKKAKSKIYRPAETEISQKDLTTKFRKINRRQSNKTHIKVFETLPFSKFRKRFYISCKRF